MCLTDLPDGWFPVNKQEAGQLGRELAAELTAPHPLFGVAAECIARRRDCDDAVFRLRGHRFEFVVVHLTWARESSAAVPATVFCAGYTDLVESLRADSR